jgi:uncharacterized protein YjaG (DUF416 family)
MIQNEKSGSVNIQQTHISSMTMSGIIEISPPNIVKEISEGKIKENRANSENKDIQHNIFQFR